MPIKILSLTLVISLTNSSLATAQQIVILVRHAERQSPDADALSDQGHSRAKALARFLQPTGVTLIVRSDTERTKQTAAPLISKRGLTEKIIPADKNHIQNAVQAIQAAGPKAVVLYVGHSNTIGPILSKLGYPGRVEIPDSEFSDLFILVPKESTPVLLRLRYGTKD